MCPEFCSRIVTGLLFPTNANLLLFQIEVGTLNKLGVEHGACVRTRARTRGRLEVSAGIQDTTQRESERERERPREKDPEMKGLRRREEDGGDGENT